MWNSDDHISWFVFCSREQLTHEIHWDEHDSWTSVRSSVLISAAEMMAAPPTRRIWFVPRLPGVRGSTSLMRTRGKPVKEEQIKSAPPSALVSADPPERACGITILPIKTAGSRPAAWKGPASHRARERSTGEGRDQRGKKSFWYTTAEWGFLVTKRIELEEDWWSGSWYAGDWRRWGLCWSLYEA